MTRPYKKEEVIYCLAKLNAIAHDGRRAEETRLNAEMCYRVFDALFEEFKRRERKSEELRGALRTVAEFIGE